MEHLSGSRRRLVDLPARGGFPCSTWNTERRVVPAGTLCCRKVPRIPHLASRGRWPPRRPLCSTWNVSERASRAGPGRRCSDVPRGTGLAGWWLRQLGSPPRGDHSVPGVPRGTLSGGRAATRLVGLPARAIPMFHVERQREGQPGRVVSQGAVAPDVPRGTWMARDGGLGIWQPKE